MVEVNFWLEKQHAEHYDEPVNHISSKNEQVFSEVNFHNFD